MRSAMEVTEETLQRAAKIMGPFSAAAKALEDIERRRADGQKPACVKNGEWLLVFDAASPSVGGEHPPEEER